MVQADGLECTFKSVQQVKRQHDHGNYIECYIPSDLKNFLNFMIVIFHAVGIHMLIVGKPGFVEKIAEMDDEENKNDRTHYSHVAGVPCAVLLRFVHNIFYRPCFLVLYC